MVQPAKANSLRELISKKPFTKKAGEVIQGVGPEFILGTEKKKKKKADKYMMMRKNMKVIKKESNGILRDEKYNILCEKSSR
jgi:hypothetical protein